MKATAYSSDGTSTGEEVDLPGEPFDGTVNRDVLHQVVTALRARARQGTASTKTRQTITGGGRKPWRQKGTGRARHGSIRSPIWKGGAVVFGPQPRDYNPRIPQGMKRLAIKSALNARAMEDRLLVVDDFDLEEPRTKAIVGFLESVDATDENVLVLTQGVKKVVYLSARNIPEVEVRPWGEASAYDILWSDLVVVERSALEGGGPRPGDEQAEEEVEE